MDHCLHILILLMEHWKQLEKREESDGSVSGTLLKPQPSHSPPDMSPFFLRQYVKVCVYLEMDIMHQVHDDAVFICSFDLKG